MPKLTAQEFADLCEMGTNQLSISINRDKKVVVKDDLIDTDNPVNKQFLEKRKITNERAAARGKAPFVPKHAGKKISAAKTPPQAKTPTATPATTKKNTTAPDPGEYGHSKELERLRVANAELERQKRLLDLEKKRGETIPVELFRGLLKQNNQMYIRAFQQSLERVVDRVGIKYKASAADQAEMRKTVIGEINTGVKAAHKEILSQIKLIVSEYSDTKERGERAL